MAAPQESDVDIESPLACPLCPPTSQKRYRAGRSLKMHVGQVHATVVSEAGSLDELAAKVAADAVEFTRALHARRAARPSRKRKGQPKQKDYDKKRRPPPDWVAAARDGDLEALRGMQEAGEWDWDTKDRHGSTAEQYAAGGGQLECLKFCLGLRFATCPRHKQPREAWSGPCECEPSHARRRDGRGALHWAARNGHEETVRYLVEDAEAAVEATTFDGTTALMYAVFGGHAGVARRLVALGADLRRCNNWDCDLAHWVAISKSEDAAALRALCEWLREEGLDFTRAQKEGRTPLHKAAFVNNEAVVSWLMDSLEPGKARALVACKDEGGKTADQLAEQAGHAALADRIRSTLSTSP